MQRFSIHFQLWLLRVTGRTYPLSPPLEGSLLAPAGLPVVLTEGEFDALTSWQVGWGNAIGRVDWQRQQSAHQSALVR
ncbi:MAG: toprim domain-containing protein [Chloroflexota bacterium]